MKSLNVRAAGARLAVKLMRFTKFKSRGENGATVAR